MRIAVIEYGIGNCRSVANALARVGGAAEIVASGEALVAHDPDIVVLPGVGAIGAALDNLAARGFRPVLERLVREEGRPFLGICVGLQVLAEECVEFGRHEGFGWIDGTVERLDVRRPGLRLPHVGWNTLEATGRDPALDAVDGAHVYFVHSCAITCDSADVSAYTGYGDRFVAAVRRGNIRAVQFHPEKSSAAGERLLHAFLTEAGSFSSAA